MKIKFDQNPEQLKLIQAMGSNEKSVSIAAMEAFARLLAPTIGRVLQQADTTGMIYKDFTFNQDEDPSLPLELFMDVPEGYFTIWQQTLAGGLPTSTVHQPIQEVKFTTYRLDAAVSYLKKYARRPRIDVVARALERLAQEILLKRQRIAWSVVLSALAKASHKVNGTAKKHVVRAQNTGRLTFADLNKFITYFRRMNMSWADGTPTVEGGKLTDLVVSPEIKEGLRAMSYTPINTTGPNGLALSTSNAGSASTVLLPEAQRAAMFNGSEMQSIYGINIHELMELGKGYKYNTLFDSVAGSTSYTDVAGASGAAFDGAVSEIVLALDLARDFAYRAVETSGDNQSTFSLVPDDQFLTRSEKIGFYGYLVEGRMVLDTRPIMGLIV